jgi:hypothetical protein
MIRKHIPTSKLAEYVNTIEGIDCRPRTKEEEAEYLAALPKREKWINPADSIEISDYKVRQIKSRMRRRVDCNRARACHELGATVGQFERALKRMEAATK